MHSHIWKNWQANDYFAKKVQSTFLKITEMSTILINII